MPGGVLADIKPQQSGNAQKQYTLPSIEGRTLLTTDASGTNTSTGTGPLSSFAYDPFGNAIGSLPTNAGSGSYGYGGSLQKFTEITLALMPTQMGARVYFSTLGRFASVDPIDGGTPNRYVYVLDPINGSDYSGLGVTIVTIFSFFGPNQSSTGNPQAGASAVKLQSSYATKPLTIVGVANYRGPAAARATIKSPSVGDHLARAFVGVGNATGGVIQNIQSIPKASIAIATSTTAGCASGALQGIGFGMMIETFTHEEEVSEYTAAGGCVIGGAAAGLNAVRKGLGRPVESLDQALMFWEIYIKLIQGGI